MSGPEERRTLRQTPATTPCFTPGTLIATGRGLRPVERISPGEKVVTRDDGLREVLWIGRRTLSFAEIARAEEFRPVLVRQSALGGGRPHRDMIVSPRHRFLMAGSSDGTREEVLTQAVRLVDWRGILPVRVLGVTYLHLLFARHQVILADGAWTESFRPGPTEWRGLGHGQRLEIESLFPELATGAAYRLTRPARTLDDRPLWKRRMEARPEREG